MSVSVQGTGESAEDVCHIMMVGPVLTSDKSFLGLNANERDETRTPTSPRNSCSTSLNQNLDAMTWRRASIRSDCDASRELEGISDAALIHCATRSTVVTAVGLDHDFATWRDQIESAGEHVDELTRLNATNTSEGSHLSTMLVSTSPTADIVGITTPKQEIVDNALSVQLAYSSDQVAPGHKALPRFIVLMPSFPSHQPDLQQIIFSILDHAAGMTRYELPDDLEAGSVHERGLEVEQRSWWHFLLCCHCCNVNEPSDILFPALFCCICVGFLGLVAWTVFVSYSRHHD